MGRTDQRSFPITLMAVAAVLLVARVACAPRETRSEASGPQLVKWHRPAEGLRLAKESGKLVMYDFTAEWCRPCHMLEAEVFRNRDVAEQINERFIAIRVTDRLREEGKNTPEVAALNARYNVRGFPTVVFADANGTERARMEGFGGRDHFVRIMERAR